jgi:hypothetical protein
MSKTGRTPSELRSSRYHASRGNPCGGEEARDGPHDHNRGGGSRGSVAPTALRLLRVGAGTAGPCTTLEAAPFSHPARSSLCPTPMP